jgi:organic hydroperoxide reductase OsmC/OhrA
MTSSSKKNSTRPTKIAQKAVDETLEETFPASDAPAWTIAKKHPKQTDQHILEDRISIEWRRETKDFEYETYNRNAALTFGGKQQIRVSNPPAYHGEEKYPNAEELFISAVAFCYLQTFLAVASKQGYTIDHYIDNTTGILGKNKKDRMAITEIHLNPTVTFSGIQPSDAALQNIKKIAHDNCFVANSVDAKIMIKINKK